MRKQFDIKYRPQIESGEYKVETRDGKKVRVLCYDANNITPVVALVTFNDGSEGSRDYYHDGSMNFDRENPLDLFIVTPEPELTKFELQLLDWLSSDTCGEIPMEKMKECVKVRASELLDLVKKELVDDMQLQFNEAYYRGRKDGKAEALKDLPRWRKWENGACGNGLGIPIAIVKRGLNGYELVEALCNQGEQYIMLSDLEKLPRED